MADDHHEEAISLDQPIPEPPWIGKRGSDVVRPSELPVRPSEPPPLPPPTTGTGAASETENDSGNGDGE